MPTFTFRLAVDDEPFDDEKIRVELPSRESARREALRVASALLADREGNQPLQVRVEVLEGNEPILAGRAIIEMIDHST